MHASSRLSFAARPDRVLTSLEPSKWARHREMSVTRRDSLRFSRIPGRVLSQPLQPTPERPMRWSDYLHGQDPNEDYAKAYKAYDLNSD
ncbi:ZWICHEL kinesin-like calmodulin-binding protein [Prunus dulcis]|uniref:ZWICHEL kinesin-like calmodulin-binding protein n=1 Tax=Prunus dulcis TaxID=3755 RepID=A0A4Y1RNK5_PRUDU|nr:ZWICHEL kinesin-like calmodulin-binding protein [Prunus dulcis]